MNLKIIFKRVILLDLSLLILIFISVFFESEMVIAFNEGISQSNNMNDMLGVIALFFLVLYLVNLYLLYKFKNIGKQIGHQKKWKKSVFEVYKQYSLNRKWNHDLIKTAKKAKIQWLTTPYDFDAVKNLDEFLPVYKIGSVDITWLEFIDFAIYIFSPNGL